MQKHRHLALLLTILLLCTFCVGHEEEDDFSTQFISNLFNQRYVSRAECMEYVMKAIGAGEMDSEGARQIRFYIQPVPDAYSCNEYAYILAGYGHKITYGTYSDDDWIEYHHGQRLFKPHRVITVNECIAFLVRCYDRSSYSITLEDAWEKAVNDKLILPDDPFYDSPQSDLTHADFSLLLSRFLQMECGFHWDGKLYKEKAKGGITYLDNLKQLTAEQS